MNYAAVSQAREATQPSLAMVVLDADARVLDLSPDAEHLIGRSAWDLSGNSVDPSDDLFGSQVTVEATPMLGPAGSRFTVLRPRPAARAERRYGLPDLLYVDVAWPNGRSQNWIVSAAVDQYLGVRESHGVDWFALWRRAVHRDDRAIESRFLAGVDKMGKGGVATQGQGPGMGTVKP